ncbi:unnamed protein product [Linum trigynum]|uniref:KIB1-4 beta-propeller domain-containing protein n=1 Tax=Linum trigynum TaxID=586398 RepID=A0AAV2CV38_9ROSI
MRRRCRWFSISNPPCKAKAIFKWSCSGSSPVFHNGAFYCLDQQGRLRVLEPRSNKWRLLTTEHSAFTNKPTNQGYLMESHKGELISIVVGPRGKSVTVLKLDKNRTVWRRMTDVEGRVVFLSPASCMTMSCEELGVEQ